MSQDVCLIIGAGPGLGLALARRFAREGMQVVLLARNAAWLQQATADLRAQGYLAACYAVDAADLSALQRVVAQVKTEIGPVEVLIYNAAAHSAALLSDIPPADFTQLYRANVVGALAAAQQVLPAMRAAGRGTLLFTGGGLADNPTFRAAALSFGKAGIRLLATLLHQELADTALVVGTVTIRGTVREGTHFDPAHIADAFWQLHQRGRQPTAELLYE